jgi:dehydrogenase/reductase SDR family protein 7
LQKHGHIINTSSVAGKMGSPRSATYSATKHAIQGFFDALRMECAEHNLLVTNVCPGPVASEITLHAFTEVVGKSHDKPQEAEIKRMTAERCAFLMSVAMWAKLPEIWVSPQPILSYLYMGE